MNKYLLTRKTLTAFALASITLLSATYCAYASPYWVIVPEENRDEMVSMRLAGVEGNKALAVRLTELLKNPPPSQNFNYIPVHGGHSKHLVNYLPIDNDYRIALMHSLALLGAVGAVPEMDNIIQTNKDPDVVNYAKVCKARLLAESGTPTKPGAATAKQLNLKIQRFLSEMGCTVADLNAGADEADAAHRDFLASPHSDGGSITPLRLLAMREVADIVYRDGFVAPSAVPALKGVEFNRDAPSALKMLLAPLTRQQRIDALIREVTTYTRHFSTKQIAAASIAQCEQQLLCDEDLAAKKSLAGVLLPRVASANGEQATAPNADVAATFDKAHGTSGGGMELVNMYNNIAGDGSVPLVLSGGWQSDMTATHILRRQFVTEY